MIGPCALNGHPADAGTTSSPMSSTYTGSRAEHVMSGAPIIVAMRSRAEAGCGWP